MKKLLLILPLRAYTVYLAQTNHMKRLLIIIICLISIEPVFAQRFTPNTPQDSILCSIDDAVSSLVFNDEHYGRYKIYPTENIHILLKLDTASGIIKMVQWSLKQDEEFEVFINTEWLATGILAKKGRFELYPTKNMYQFILLDTLMGSTWHVQWGTKEGEFGIRRISY
jgi:hypothetical protein